MISRAILSTLTYSDHFAFPLQEEEIYERLIQVKTTRPSLHTALKKLIQRRQIRLISGFYHLPSRESLVPKRVRSHKLSQKELKKAHQLASILARFPSVLAIYLTGSLAVENSDTEGDIDFMIITQNGRLWTTRFILTLYCTLFDLRRTPHSTQNQGKLCLNLYLTPDSFKLPKARRSLYTAYELIQAKPLYDPKNTRASLLQANSWIKKFLPNYPTPSKYTPDNYPIAQLPSYQKFIENLAYRVQKKYMSKRITPEYITPSAAFFHPRDPSPKL